MGMTIDEIINSVDLVSKGKTGIMSLNFKNCKKFIDNKLKLMAVVDEFDSGELRYYAYDPITNTHDFKLKVDNLIERTLIEEDNQVAEVAENKLKNCISYIKKTVSIKELEDNVDIVKFNNITINYSNKEEYKGKKIVTNSIPHNLILDEDDLNTTKLKFVKQTLMEWANFDERTYIEILEVAGYLLNKDVQMRKAIFLIGNSSNGKSVFFDLIEMVVGKHNISYQTLTDISANTFSTIKLLGKTLNIDADISNDDIMKNVSKFKKIVSGDTITGEEKNMSRIAFKPTVTLLFGANAMPRISDKGNSSATDDRIKMITFNNKFKRKAPSDIKEWRKKLFNEKAYEAFICLAFNQYYQLIKNKKDFTENWESREAKSKNTRRNNNVIDFIAQLGVLPKQVHIDQIYSEYRRWHDVESKFSYEKTEFKEKFIVACKKALNIDAKEMRTSVPKEDWFLLIRKEKK